MASLLSLLWMPAPLQAVGQRSGTPSPREVPSGTVVGRVVLPTGAGAQAHPRAVLLPPEWAESWDREVQERIDIYSSRYLALLLRDPEQFEQVSRLARRDATEAVLLRMQARLGAGFRDLLQSVPPDGSFEFANIPLGDYKILVLTEDGPAPHIWIETVSLRDSIPVFVELDDPVQ